VANPLKRAIQPAVPQFRALIYAGRGRQCPCCGRHFRRFRSTGQPRRPDAACPYCNSVERHRLLTLLIRAEPELVSGRVLHFAAEPALSRLIRAHAAEYVTTDLSADSDVTADIVSLPFPDGRWDALVCSHVLEHVPDDARAIRELRRVLAPGGSAIILVPRRTGAPTDEDPTVTDPAARQQRFGQHDHVRMYGDDLEERLRSNGFAQLRRIGPEDFTPEQVRRHRLLPINAGAEDALLICR
jgi:SAM-dependent methyltransferase